MLATGTSTFPARRHYPKRPPPRLDAEDLAVVAALCGGEVSKSWPEERPTCRVPRACEPDPIVVQAVHRGSFSSSDAREAIVHFDNPCAPHAHNFAGEALVRRSEGSWKLVSLHEGSLMNGPCLSYPTKPPAGGFLVCEDTYAAIDGGREWTVQLVGVKGDLIYAEHLLDLELPNPQSCGVQGSVSWSKPSAPQASDIDGDGLLDLRIRVTLAESSVPPDCERQVQGEPGRDLATATTGVGWDVGKSITCQRTVTLDFSNSRGGLKPTAATASEIRRIERGSYCR